MATHDFIAQMLESETLREDAATRFWSKVDRTGNNGCWTWRGATTRGGYGSFKVAGRYTERSHRVAYGLHHGRSPGRFHVCHTCDNPSCVNPLHLFPGTNETNVADKVAKGRARGADQRGDRNHSARLTSADVGTIKARLRRGESNTNIARDFGVTHAMISRIRTGKAWAMVDAVGIEPTTPPV